MKQILKLFRRTARKSRISNSIHPPRQSCDRIGRFSIAIAFYRSSARRRISARRIATVVVALSSIALPSLILREGAGFPGCIKLSINPSRGTRDAENARVATTARASARSLPENASGTPMDPYVHTRGWKPSLHHTHLQRTNTICMRALVRVITRGRCTLRRKSESRLCNDSTREDREGEGRIIIHQKKLYTSSVYSIEGSRDRWIRLPLRSKCGGGTESIVSAKRWLDRLIESRTGTRGGSKEKGDWRLVRRDEAYLNKGIVNHRPT